MADTPEVPSVLIEQRQKKTSFMWVLPMIALVVVGVLTFQVWESDPVEVKVNFTRAHGLAVGDPVRIRDIDVGEVGSLNLSSNTLLVNAVLRIRPAYAKFLREGSRIWIERPRVSFNGFEGLDTVLGAQYVGIIPGDGPIVDSFVGLDLPPSHVDFKPGDIEVVLESPQRYGMRSGSIVSYRGLPAGRIHSVDLSSDATTVESRIRIDARYAPLVRKKTRFFITSGAQLGLSFKGLSLDVDSMESLVAGGIAFATPSNAGGRADTGSRFRVALRPDDDWLEWNPRIAIGEFGVGTVTCPPIMRVTLQWKTDLLRFRRRSIGWMLPTEDGVYIPSILISTTDEMRDPRLSFAGDKINPTVFPPEEGSGLVRKIFLDLPPNTPRLPTMAVRGPLQNSDGKILTEMALLWTGTDPVPLPEHLLKVRESAYDIDGRLIFAPEDQGAPVTSARSGDLIGLLIVDGDGRGKVAFIPSGSR